MRVIANSYLKFREMGPILREIVIDVDLRIAFGYGANAEEVLVQSARRPHSHSCPRDLAENPSILRTLETWRQNDR